MTIQTTKIENGTITLPSPLQEQWTKAKVLIFPFNDSLIIKKLEEPSELLWAEYEQKLKKAKGKISAKTIDDATGWAKKRK